LAYSSVTERCSELLTTTEFQKLTRIFRVLPSGYCCASSSRDVGVSLHVLVIGRHVFTTLPSISVFASRFAGLSFGLRPEEQRYDERADQRKEPDKCHLGKELRSAIEAATHNGNGDPCVEGDNNKQ
jgi:hypothetical protein